MKIINRQTGETIVEVLISMAVLGLVLAASYALANRSGQANQRAQERAEALGENSGQIELLKTYLEDDGTIPAGTFCVYRDNTEELKATSAFSGTIPANAQNDDLTSYPGECTAGPDNRYHTSVRKTTNADSTITYIFTTRWFRAAAGGVDELSTQYKVYKASEVAYDPNADSQPTDIVLPTCTANQYLDSSSSTCLPCPPSFTSPIGSTDCTFTATIEGKDFVHTSEKYNCEPDTTAYRPFNDGHDGCFIHGTSMYAWRNVYFYYTPPSGLKPGPVQITITYRNWSTDPPGNYEYELDARLGDAAKAIDPRLEDDDNTIVGRRGHGKAAEAAAQGPNIFSLASDKPDVQRTYTNTMTLRSPLSTAAKLSFRWYNDNWTNGDANLRIEKITLTQTWPQ